MGGLKGQVFWLEVVGEASRHVCGLGRRVTMHLQAPSFTPSSPHHFRDPTLGPRHLTANSFYCTFWDLSTTGGLGPLYLGAYVGPLKCGVKFHSGNLVLTGPRKKLDFKMVHKG